MSNIQKRKNGYLVRVSNGRTNGKQNIISKMVHRIIGETDAHFIKRVQDFADELENAVKNGSYEEFLTDYCGKDPDITLGEYSKIYLSKIKKEMSPNTVALYDYVINGILVPTYGDIRIKDFNDLHYHHFISCLSGENSRQDQNNKSGLAPVTVKRYASIMSSMFKSAWEDRIVHSDVLRIHPVRLPRVDHIPKAVYGVEEIRRFLNALDDEKTMVKCFFTLAALAGMRRGELLALTWEDIDYRHNVIRVNKSAYKSVGEPAKIKNTKTSSSVRRVFFEEMVKNVLKEWQIEQLCLKDSKPHGWNADEHIFTSEKGEIWNKDIPTHKIKEIEKKAGLKDLNLHLLRHTYASLCAASGVNNVDISKSLGHASMRTTEIYLASTDEQQKKIPAKIEKMISEDEEDENDET